MDLVNIRNRIEETNQILGQLERSLASNPHVESLALEIESLARQRDALEAEFASAANQIGKDICTYRITGIGDRRPTVQTITSVLSRFQRAVTIVYDGLVNGPKERGRVRAESYNITSFEFGYTSPGSLIVTLTISNDRLMFRGSDLDDAVTTVFDMACAKSTSDIRGYVDKVGYAAVQGLYSWVDSHVEAGVGVDLIWQRELDVRADLLMDHPQFEYLRTVIDEVGAALEEDIVITGWLMGADLKTGQFRLQGPEGSEVTGKFDDAISESHVAQLPHRYTAELRKTSQLVESTGKSKESYFLRSLRSAMTE